LPVPDPPMTTLMRPRSISSDTAAQDAFEP
jgi:hypothetical protein